MFPLDPVAAIALSLLLSYVLVDAGLHKLRDPARYGAVIDGYRLLPRGLGAGVAAPLGALEVGLGAGVLLPFTHLPALAGSAALIVGYFLAIAINLARGRRDIDCGCGAPEQAQRLSPALLLRNATLVAAALLLLSTPGGAPAHWSGWAFALFAGAVAALLYASINALLSNAQLLERLR